MRIRRGPGSLDKKGVDLLLQLRGKRIFVGRLADKPLRFFFLPCFHGGSNQAQADRPVFRITLQLFVKILFTRPHFNPFEKLKRLQENILELNLHRWTRVQLQGEDAG